MAGTSPAMTEVRSSCGPVPERYLGGGGFGDATGLHLAEDEEADDGEVAEVEGGAEAAKAGA